MSLIPNTFNGLVSAVKALAEDDSTEFEAYIPTAIFIAEENLSRVVDTDGFKTSAVVTATPGNNLISKPANHKFNRNMWFSTSARQVNTVDIKNSDYIQDYWPVGTVSTSSYPYGQPKYYGNYDKDNWIIAPTPVSAYPFSVKYDAQVTHLSAANQTNYYTSVTPEALLYGTMVGMAEFMKDYGTLAHWQTRYVAAVEAVGNEGRRNRRDNGSTPNNPESGQNTLNEDN